MNQTLVPLRVVLAHSGEKTAVYFYIIAKIMSNTSILNRKLPEVVPMVSLYMHAQLCPIYRAINPTIGLYCSYSHVSNKTDIKGSYKRLCHSFVLSVAMCAGVQYKMMKITRSNAKELFFFVPFFFVLISFNKTRHFLNLTKYVVVSLNFTKNHTRVFDQDVDMVTRPLCKGLSPMSPSDTRAD